MKMKRIVALALVAVMLTMTLASCGTKLSGTYSAEIIGSGVEYEFKGSKVSITVKALGMELGSAEGKYSIKKDKITFTFDSDDEDVEKYDGTFDFEKGDDYIKIGAITYKKAD